jgi:hypothetical protein
LSKIAVAKNEYMDVNSVIQLGQIQIVNLTDNNAVELKSISLESAGQKIDTEPENEISEQGENKGELSGPGVNSNPVVPIVTDFRGKLISAITTLLDINDIESSDIKAREIISVCEDENQFAEIKKLFENKEDYIQELQISLQNINQFKDNPVYDILRELKNVFREYNKDYNQVKLC